MAKRLCPNGACELVKVRGSFRQQCKNCKDPYPCKSHCTHYDCQDIRVVNGVATDKDHEARNRRATKWPIKGLPIPEISGTDGQETGQDQN